MAENQLAAELERPGIGHNLPPLAELIDDLSPMVDQWCVETIEPYKPRVEEMLEAIKTAVILDDESAAKVAVLVAMLRDMEQELERRHDEMKRPILEAGRAIDRAFGAMRHPIELARRGEDGRGGLRGMLTAYEHRREEAARAERERYEAEARRLAEEAEAARRRADGSLASGMEALQAEEAAALAERRAAAIRPEPIRSHLGQVGQRREIGFSLTDLAAAVRWMAGKQNPLRSHLEQAARTILGKHLRSLGVDAIESGGIQIPGVKTFIATQAQVRR